MDAGLDLMTAAELRVVREWLGLTTRWLAEHLGVAERTVHRWEHGHSVIPDGVCAEMQRLEAVSAELVTAAVATCEDMRDPAILTYRSDDDYRAHHPEQPWPASWHRALAARVAHEVPGLTIGYWSDQNPLTSVSYAD